MNTNRQIFLDDLGAAAAHLRCVGRVHNNQLATSFFHFVCQQLGEQLEACIVRGERKDATYTDPISTIAYRTIAYEYFEKFKHKNDGTAYAVSKFPCRLKTTVPFGDYFGAYILSVTRYNIIRITIRII